MSNRPAPDLNQAYRTWQGAHTTEANIMEMLMNTINELNKEKLELDTDIIKLRARVVELENPVKTPAQVPPKPKK